VQLRKQLFESLLSQEIGFFDEGGHSAGELASFLAEKVTLVQSLLGEKLQLIVKFSFMFTLAFVFMFAFGDWRVCLVMLGVLPILTVINVMEMQTMGLGQHDDKEEGDASRTKSAGSLVGEAVAGIRTVASFNAEQRFYESFATVVDEMRAKGIKKGLLKGLVHGLGQGVIYPMFGAVLLYGGYLIVNGYVPAATITYVGGCADLDVQGTLRVMMPVLILVFLASYLGQIGAMVTDAKAANDASVLLFALMDRESKCNPFSDEGGAGLILKEMVPFGAAGGAIGALVRFRE